MLIQTKMHTIMLLIGPTECGKTTFSKEILMKQLQIDYPEKNFHTNIQYISSDDLRQEVLGYSYDKYDQIMLEASNIAFPYLRKKLEFVTTYPVSAEFVIVDTTGLAEEFRQEILDIAWEQNYRIEAVVFDYKDRNDYYASERSRRLISNHIQRLKREVLPKLAKENYHAIHRITKKDFSDISVSITEQEEYFSCLLEPDKNYDVVGDIHECLAAFQNLLKKLNFPLEADFSKDKTQIILAGDWIDKGKQTKEIIEFLYRYQQHFLFVLGNHENFVYNYLKGEIKGVDPYVLTHYFDSIPVLEKDEQLKEKFFSLVEQSKPFYRRIGKQEQSFIVTHAPCKQKYLGKLDKGSKRKQRNFRLNRELDIQQQLTFLEEESYFNLPLHIFGHVANKDAFRIKNKRSIDTGAASQNRLTAIRVLPFKTMLYSVPSTEGDKEELPLLFRKPKQPSWKSLPDDKQRRLRYMANKGIQYLSGTMSPAASDRENNDLESLALGLAYFKEKGISKLALQPKYMGSRCNLYLHREADQCFAISRNGYVIRNLDLNTIYENLLKKFYSKMEAENIEMLLLDGELMPWSALGKGLIQREYAPISYGIEKELAILQDSSFEQACQTAFDKMAATEYENDRHHKDKKTLSHLYGDYTARQYNLLTSVKKLQVPLVEQKEYLDTYRKQIELYGYEGELAYKPFNLLKITYQDGREVIPEENTSEIYAALSDDPQMVIDLADTQALEKAQAFFDQITVEQQMEGIVLKPDQKTSDVVPFMKVRNKEYLTLIYGYDYLSNNRYHKLIEDKKINAKLTVSMKEATLADELLQIPAADRKETNHQYMDLLANLLFEFEKEKQLDPRL